MKSFGQRDYRLIYSKRIGAYSIITNEKKQFLVVHSQDDYYFLVGGGIEHNEDPTEALKREAIEETGYSLDIITFVGKAENHWVSPQYPTLSQHNIGYFYIAKLNEKITDPIENEPVIWVSLHELEKKLFHKHHLYMIKKLQTI